MTSRRCSSSPGNATTGRTIEQQRVESYNAKEGKLTGYDCPKCRNKGLIAVLEDGEEKLVRCDCIDIRQTMKNITRSGLARLLGKYTFARYKTDTQQRATIKRTAERFVEETGNDWFFIGGQIGSGKTHICTAIVGKLLQSGVPCRYMLWRDVMSELYLSRFDEDYYEKEMRKWKHAPVLYIDDLYKGSRSGAGSERETMERNATYEIVNHRYVNGMKTLLSSEYGIEELSRIDEAVGSRIYERSKRYSITVQRNQANNARWGA